MTGHLGIAFLIALNGGAAAQASADLSGTWTITPSEHYVLEGRGNDSAGQLLVGPEALKLVISKAGDRLRIEEHRSAVVKVNTREYALNGQLVKTSIVLSTKTPGTGIEAVPSTVTSKWQENNLVSTIEVLAPGEPDPRHYSETISISPEGVLAVRIQRVGSSDSRTTLYQRSK